MNLPKSHHYHRARRRADTLAGLLSLILLAGLLLTGGSVRLRTLVGGSPAAFAAVLFTALTLVRLPFSWYRGYCLERDYGLSDVRMHHWLAGHVKIAALAVALGVLLSELVYWSMRWPGGWWLIAAAGCGGVMWLLTAVAPVLTLPLVQPSRPLQRDALRRRLEALSNRAAVPIVSVHEWRLGGATRRASAALVGAGATRRILLSDTLLANYSDDEIEVVIAHELGHHVHRHVLKTALLEGMLLLVAFLAAAMVLDVAWARLGLGAPGDVAGLPLVVLSLAGVAILSSPLLNWWSRVQERSADRFALATASEPAAFIAAVRRMSAQNLAEDRPSGAAFVLFHSHPTPEERIASARDILSARDRTPGPELAGA